jgi:hypothetical protein
VSPLNPCNRLSPSAPTIHTTGLECPSVVVTMGEPVPFKAPHQAVCIVGGEPARIFSTVSSLVFERSLPNIRLLTRAVCPASLKGHEGAIGRRIRRRSRSDWIVGDSLGGQAAADPAEITLVEKISAAVFAKRKNQALAAVLRRNVQ